MTAALFSSLIYSRDKHEGRPRKNKVQQGVEECVVNEVSGYAITANTTRLIVLTDDDYSEKFSTKVSSELLHYRVVKSS